MNNAEATPMRHQSHFKATSKRVDSQLIGTPLRPQSHPKATPMPPWGKCGLRIAECGVRNNRAKPPKATTEPKQKAESRNAPKARILHSTFCLLPSQGPGERGV